MKIPTGSLRLDELLGGGLPQGSATLVYGAPFTGKRVLSRLFVAEGLHRGEPAVLVLTKEAAVDVHQGLGDLEADYTHYAEQGMVRYVDTYSHAVGAADGSQGPLYARYLDGPMDLNALSRAVNDTQHEVIRAHQEHRLVLDSVSTLIAYANAATTFRFLQVFIGKAKRAGATMLLSMDDGMHSEAEVQMIKHLVDGVIHLKVQDAKHLVQVGGNGVTQDKGWVEYAHGERSFDVTGSFAAGRIR